MTFYIDFFELYIGRRQRRRQRCPAALSWRVGGMRLSDPGWPGMASVRADDDCRRYREVPGSDISGRPHSGGPLPGSRSPAGGSPRRIRADTFPAPATPPSAASRPRWRSHIPELTPSL